MRLLNTTIDADWEVAERVPHGRDLLFLSGGERDWLPATVPGHVHLDLMRAGVIGDPFYRMQERSSRWVDEADWTYRTTFTVDAERLAARGEYGRHFLHFHGLDTVARVILNGSLVGSAENMFVPHRFDVTDVLREGANELRVEFDSTLKLGQTRAAAYLGDGTSDRGRQGYFNFSPRAFVRKAQYMFGWDWGPELVSCGLWQPVELVTVPVAEITDWRLDYDFTGPDTARLKLTVNIVRYHPDVSIKFMAQLGVEGGFRGILDVPGVVGEHRLEQDGEARRVVRWPELLDRKHSEEYAADYGLTMDLMLSKEDFPSESGTYGRQAHVLYERCGFRDIQLVREPDADGTGEGFLFRVNGVDTYIKGANWIPDHTFPSVITRKRLERRLRQAKDAGFNMLRVWGGGLYESDDFYRLCDHLGILVWQDFPFACSLYPDDDPAFVENVRAEATAAVRRLRHHPCLALWCGGNENTELHQYRWEGATQATTFYGERLIHEVLPAVLAAEDPRTPYWPNSPYSGTPEHPSRDENYGDAHYWAVWHSHGGSTGDWIHYAESDCRFSSEFGFAAPCGWAAWESCTLPEDRHPRSPVARHHDKTRKAYETYLGYIEKHFGRVNTFDDLIYYGQANQALALAFGIEHWRRRKGRCWGTLFWQFNDCWPVQSWSIVDSAGEPKLAYYAVKRVYAPLLLSVAPPAPNNGGAGGDVPASQSPPIIGGGGGQNRVGVSAHLVNDTLKPVTGTLTLRLRDFGGAELARTETRFTAPANAASGAAATLDVPEGTDGTSAFVHAAFTAPGGELLAESITLLAEPKELRLSDPGLIWSLAPAPGEAGTWTLTLSAERFAAFLWLRFEGCVANFSDNGFHLAPGQTRTVAVSDMPEGVAGGELLARLRVRHL